jgi:hypothetical protein
MLLEFLRSGATGRAVEPIKSVGQPAELDAGRGTNEVNRPAAFAHDAHMDWRGALRCGASPHSARRLQGASAGL